MLHVLLNARMLHIPDRCTTAQLANAGVAPDLVGVFISGTDMGAIGVDGSFVYQDAGAYGGTAYVGRYLSYE